MPVTETPQTKSSSPEDPKVPQNIVDQSRMRQIAESIETLIHDAETQLAAEKEKRTNDLNSVAQNRESENERFRAEQTLIQERLKEAESTIDLWKGVLQKQHESADSHLKLQFISLDRSHLFGEPLGAKLDDALLRDPNRLWAFIENHLTLTENLHKELIQTQKPAYLVGIIGFFLIVGVIGGTTMMAWSKSGVVFAFVFLFQLLLGVGVALAVRSLTIGEIRSKYASWQMQKSGSEEYLRLYQALLREIAERDLAEAVKRNRQINDLCKSESRTIADNFDLALSRLAGKVSNLSSMAKNSCEILLEDTTYSGADLTSDIWNRWTPFSPEDGGTRNPSIRFGDLRIERNGLDPAFQGVDLSFCMPALMSMNDGRGLMIKVPGGQKGPAVQLLQSVMLRMLATFSPGMLRFMLFDPVGLGQNVAAFMPLGTHDERLITSKAWSEPEKIEEELSKTTDHLTDVIQSRLRNDHVNIEEYNEKSPALREPYRVVVAIDFPVNFRSDAARRLVSIAQNGARCGVYPLIVVDSDLLEKHAPHGFNVNSLEEHLEVVEWIDGGWVWRGFEQWAFVPSAFNAFDAKGLIETVIEKIGSRAKEAMTVVVPFKKVLEMDRLTPTQFWGGSTLKDVSIPLGPLNVKETQKLVFGGAAHHGIIIGRTGSGKSKLMDVIITTLALKYSPDEIQFYLIDLKSGVGFKPYAEAKLPHARVIAIDSEREYALSVLRDLETQMDSRHETFREKSKENISDYRAAGFDKIKKMPRILLVVDEFQNLFLEDDVIGRDAGRILERLTREGRSAGIHILLGSQSLAGKAANLPNAALGQIGIRIALMCNASDAQAIMAHDNAEARLLSRPGEAIYNDHNGLIEGNKRFQVAFLDDATQKEFLQTIAEKDGGTLREQLIFEGNQMARLEECRPFGNMLSGEIPSDSKRIDAWIGEPISIREPISVRFRRQSGNNLLVVAHDEGEGVGMMISALLSLAAQHHPNDADFFALNYTNAEEKWHELVFELGTMLPHKVGVFGRSGLSDVLSELWDECQIRSNGSKGDSKRKYLFIFGMQRAKDLRSEETGRSSIFDQSEKKASSAELFSKLIRDGSENGIHIIVWCDMANNVKRTLSRNLINEFNYRVATRMSQDDSQFVVENTAASKLDRPHRAVFYDEDRPGFLEKFRPFAVPSDRRWLEEMTEGLSSHHTKQQAG